MALAKTTRFKINKGSLNSLKKGRIFNSKVFALIYKENNILNTYKASVFLTKKIDARSVVRNSIKRKISNSFIRISKKYKIKPGYYLIKPNKFIVEENNRSIEEKLLAVLKNEGLLE